MTTQQELSDLLAYPYKYFQDRCLNRGTRHPCLKCLYRYRPPAHLNTGPHTQHEYLDDIYQEPQHEIEEPPFEEQQPEYQEAQHMPTHQPAFEEPQPTPMYQYPPQTPAPFPAFGESASVYSPPPATSMQAPEPIYHQPPSQAMIPRPQRAPLQYSHSALPPQGHDSMSMAPLRQALPSAGPAQPAGKTIHNVYAPNYNFTDSRSYKNKYAPRNNQTIAPKTNTTIAPRTNTNTKQRANFGTQVNNRQALASSYGYGIPPGRTRASLGQRPPANPHAPAAQPHRPPPAAQRPSPTAQCPPSAAQRPPPSSQRGPALPRGNSARPQMPYAASAPPRMRQPAPGRAPAPQMGRQGSMFGGKAAAPQMGRQGSMFGNNRGPAARPSGGAPRMGGGGGMRSGMGSTTGGGMGGGMRGGRRGR